MGRGNTRLMAVMHTNLGANLASAGQTLRAVAAYQRSLRLFRGFGDNAAIPTLEANYAGQLVELGRPREAMPLIEHARAQASGNQRLAALVSLRGAPAWCAIRDMQGCAELLAGAEAGFNKTLPPTHFRFGALKVAQAQLAAANDDLPRSHALLKQAVALFDAATDQSNIGIGALSLLARTEQQLGELDAAEANAVRAVAQAREAMAGFERSRWLGNALVALGLVQQARGESAAAQGSWRAALTQLQATLGESAPATEEVRRLMAGA
jgi:tetratricopeptide (TPR) repeat protein